ncbi:MAG: DUF5368 domain-containing protein [Pseudolabrys sp.]
MRELDPLVFVAVLQEMLGGLFWPLIALVVVGAVAFVGVIVRDRGIHARRFLIAELVGVAGGFAGIWFVLAITSSQLSDVGGPIDWVLMLAIWLAGAVGATVVVYIVLSLGRIASAREVTAGERGDFS